MCDAPVIFTDQHHTYVTLGLNPTDQRHIYVCDVCTSWLQVSCILLFYFINTTVVPRSIGICNTHLCGLVWVRKFTFSVWEFFPLQSWLLFVYQEEKSKLFFMPHLQWIKKQYWALPDTMLHWKIPIKINKQKVFIYIYLYYAK